MWTLWLICYATVMGQGGGAAPAVTPLATYQTQEECYQSIDQVYALMKKEFGMKNPPSPGLMFCVSGKPVGK
jgi:hypothetical protein